MSLVMRPLPPLVNAFGNGFTKITRCREKRRRRNGCRFYRNLLRDEIEQRRDGRPERRAQTGSQGEPDVEAAGRFRGDRRRRQRPLAKQRHNANEKSKVAFGRLRLRIRALRHARGSCRRSHRRLRSGGHSEQGTRRPRSFRTKCAASLVRVIFAARAKSSSSFGFTSINKVACGC